MIKTKEDYQEVTILKAIILITLDQEAETVKEAPKVFLDHILRERMIRMKKLNLKLKRALTLTMNLSMKKTTILKEIKNKLFILFL